MRAHVDLRGQHAFVLRHQLCWLLRRQRLLHQRWHHHGRYARHWDQVHAELLQRGQLYDARGRLQRHRRQFVLCQWLGLLWWHPTRVSAVSAHSVVLNSNAR
jgi:hypothetical protein